jgi:dolichol-phosphate mannosyltransferase
LPISVLPWNGLLVSDSSNDSLRVSLVIPALNESGRIRLTLGAYLLAMRQKWGDQFEVIVVSNNCTDNTPELVQEEAEKHPELMSVDINRRLGKGGAVIEGFNRARGEVLMFADADGSTDPDSLNHLAEIVLAGADAAIGSRWLPDSVVPLKQSLMRRIASRTFNLIFRVLFQLDFKDTQCGAKAFRADKLRPILESVTNRGWAFDVDLLWRLNLTYPDADIREVPVTWHDSSASRLRMHRDAPSMLWSLIKLRLGK